MITYQSGVSEKRPLSGTAIILFLSALFVLCAGLLEAETVPPKPDRYFNDYASVVPTDTGMRFNEQLAQFERETSNQVLVAVYPKMESNSDVADYTQRIAQSWGVGQKGRNNGTVLFVFIEDRKMFIQVGYGLEGALPDATAYDITEFQIKPHFKAGDYPGGLAAGIDSICKAIRGEYKGSGHTVKERERKQNSSIPLIIFFVIFIILVIRITRASRKPGYRYSGFGGPFLGGWSGGSSGGGWSSGGGDGGGFSGFSGGGGGFGGGGSGSSW